MKTINRLGIIEFIYKTLNLGYKNLVSYLKVIMLQVRGYDIADGVHIEKHACIVQSKKGAVKINSGSQIGSGVRLKAGFNGKIHIGRNVLIDDYSFVSAQSNITIGDETMIAAHVYIVDFNHIFPLNLSKKNIGSEKGYTRKEVSIGKYVWIGANAIILPGVTIGDGAVIGAGAVVTKNIPKNAVAVGNPAKILRK